MNSKDGIDFAMLFTPRERLRRLQLWGKHRQIVSNNRIKNLNVRLIFSGMAASCDRVAGNLYFYSSLTSWCQYLVIEDNTMNVNASDQITLMTAIMAQQVRQLAEIQEMITESTAKLPQVSTDPNLGQIINIRV